MSREEIDEYLASIDKPGCDTLQALRKTIQGVLPEAEQGISYGLPAFRLNGKVVAGFAAIKNHLSCRIAVLCWAGWARMSPRIRPPRGSAVWD